MPALAFTADLAHAAAVALAALTIEAAFGYPDRLVRGVGHPVAAFGAFIAWLDRRLNCEEHGFARRRAQGALAALSLLVVVGGATCALTVALRALPFGWAWEALAASALLAQRSLYDHVKAVADALRRDRAAGRAFDDPAEGRATVAMIVGRDATRLDRAGVSRAAIESLSENFSDGVVAPALWLAIGGLPGIALYKAINTADSMIGHRSPRYEAFGWAAARLDDLVNLPAARLTAALLAAAAGKRAGAAARTALRDAGRHKSPNAGWPEAAAAGALGLRLGGPRRYGDSQVDGAWLGDGRAETDETDVDAGLKLYVRACVGLSLLAAAWLVAVAAPF